MNDADKPPFRPYKKHVILCTGPRCSEQGVGASLYQHLKQRLKELELEDGFERIQRSQAPCLGVCQGGPVGVIYPEGVWYHHLTQEKIERIIQDHLLDARPVQEWILFCHSSENDQVIP